MKHCGIAILLFLFLAVSPAIASAEPLLTHTDVFTSGKDGYHTYRIPAVETAPDGSLIAIAEGRKYNRRGAGFNNNDVDLVMKRSTDGGQTWSKLTVIDDPGEKWSVCNPVTVVDRTTGRVWLFLIRLKPGRTSATSRLGTDDCQAWARYSDDHGASWSQAIDITQVARDVENWGSIFFGPGGAIQNRKGRLIVPLSVTTGHRDAQNKIVDGSWNMFAIYSNDHGRTWHRGQLLPIRDGGNENQLVELADGRILMDARQVTGSHRWLRTSGDGGVTWSKPQPGVTASPVACAIERYTLKSAGDDRNRILWTGPKGPGRTRLVVRTSYDEGKTFTNERLISQEKAAYSDLTILKDETVGVLWERGVKQGHEFITFTRFNQEFFEATTPQP